MANGWVDCRNASFCTWDCRSGKDISKYWPKQFNQQIQFNANSGSIRIRVIKSHDVINETHATLFMSLI